VELDLRDLRGGEKVWSWVKKGIPIRLEIGPRDIAQDAVFMARRDKPANEKQAMGRSAFIEGLPMLLDAIQDGLFAAAKKRTQERTRELNSKDEVYAFFKGDDIASGGFALTHWSGEAEVEAQLKTDLGVTLRCIPLEASEPGTCPFTGKPSKQRVVWAKAY
jgi:prolyl-tRNA synthetase